MEVPTAFLRAVPKSTGLAFLTAGAILLSLAFAFAHLPMVTETSCDPDGSGGEVCRASIGPGPVARFGGFLFFLGWLLPVAGLLVLSAHAGGVEAWIGFLLAAAVLAALLILVTLYMMVATL